MFPCSLKQGSCSLVPYDIFPLFPCSPKPLGDPHFQLSLGIWSKYGLQRVESLLGGLL